MLLRAEEIYMKFREETIKIVIPKMLLLVLLKQVNRHLEVLSYEQGTIDNFAIQDDMNNAEMIMTKLLILISEPNNKKHILFELSVAEFLVLRDLVFCNFSLPHLRTKMKPYIQHAYKRFYDDIESIFGMLEQDEVKAYWDYIKNYKIKGSILQ
jgi:hypothetical protein